MTAGSAAVAELAAGSEKTSTHHQGHDMSDPRMAQTMERDMRTRFLVAFGLTLLTVLYSPLASSVAGVHLPAPLPAEWIMLGLSTPVVWWCGWVFISGAYQALRRRALDMSVLIATGVLAAYLASLLLTLLGTHESFYEAAAMLVTFVLFGHWMEMKSRRGTTDALRALLELVPPTATVIRGGQEVNVPSAEVQVGDPVLLRPGSKAPVDGEVLEGHTSMNEALITGESLPVDKQAGDAIVGGSINLSGTVTFRATKVGADTALAQIVQLVAEAQNSKAPGQRLADRAAQYLVILAVGSGVLTFGLWLGVGAPFLTALTFAISAVVIACPDALGLATPTAVAVGTGIGARHGILIKDAATLEGISRVDTVVFDKTGTLTVGRPEVTDVIPADGTAEGDLLRVAAAAEHSSEHPLAGAIVRQAQGAGLDLPRAASFSSLAGHGIEAIVEGRSVLVGSPNLLDERHVTVDGLLPAGQALAEAGKTPVFVAVDGRAVGVMGLADTTKPAATEAVRQLREARLEVAMLTGDNERTARAIAARLGIERVLAGVLPSRKAEEVRRLQGEGKVVAMVGDGVNDAPALVQANIGIAIGAGTDVAIEAARVVLTKSDPLDVVKAIRLSRATVTKMKQNLAWASVYNVLAIPIAAGVLFPGWGIMLRPEWSALLMSLSSIIVATNAVLLKRVDGALGLSRETGSADRHLTVGQR